MTDASSQWAIGRGAFDHAGASAPRMRNSRPMSCALLMLMPGGARRTTSSRAGKRTRYVRFEKPRPNWSSSGVALEPGHALRAATRRARRRRSSIRGGRRSAGRGAPAWSATAYTDVTRRLSPR